MKNLLTIFAALLLALTSFPLHQAWTAEKWTEAQIEAELAARKLVPEGGNFQPEPQIPVIIAVGQGGRIILSTDDGQSWEQVYFGAPTPGHIGHWMTRSAAYTGGLFLVPLGSGKPAMVLASDDGRNWRHLLPPESEQEAAEKFDPLDMPEAWTMDGGDGTFIWGSWCLKLTPDFGKTWYQTDLGQVTQDDPRELKTRQLKPFYLGEPGRFFIPADDSSPENRAVANLFLTEDNGKSWKWLQPSGLEDGAETTGADFAYVGDTWVFSTRAGEIYRSTDEGRTWEGPTKVGARSPYLAVVNGEFWLTGPKSFSSKDGKEWAPLPEAIPNGSVFQSPSGALFSVRYSRSNIMRSTDDGETWEVVFSFEPVRGANGLVDVEFGEVRASKE